MNNMGTSARVGMCVRWGHLAAAHICLTHQGYWKNRGQEGTAIRRGMARNKINWDHIYYSLMTVLKTLNHFWWEWKKAPYVLDIRQVISQLPSNFGSLSCSIVPQN